MVFVSKCLETRFQSRDVFRSEMLESRIPKTKWFSFRNVWKYIPKSKCLLFKMFENTFPKSSTTNNFQVLDFYKFLCSRWSPLTPQLMSLGHWCNGRTEGAAGEALEGSNGHSSFVEPATCLSEGRRWGLLLLPKVVASGSFCAIYWLKKRGLMPGLTASNELI